MRAVRRDGRVVECTGLNRQGFVAPLGFKSSLHHYLNRLQGGFLSGENNVSKHTFYTIRMINMFYFGVSSYFYHSGLMYLLLWLMMHNQITGCYPQLRMALV